MTGIMKLNIGGQERTLRFNNFSAIELAKIIYNGDQPNFETEDLMNRIMKLNEKNHYLLIKTLIYSGIIGNDYVVGFTESATPQQVGEWISDLSSEEIYSVWITFWQSMGVDLPAINDIENNSVAEKKNQPGMKSAKKSLVK
jgi:hypothetical protein